MTMHATTPRYDQFGRLISGAATITLTRDQLAALLAVPVSRFHATSDPARAADQARVIADEVVQRAAYLMPSPSHSLSQFHVNDNQHQIVNDGIDDLANLIVCNAPPNACGGMILLGAARMLGHLAGHLDTMRERDGKPRMGLEASTREAYDLINTARPAAQPPEPKATGLSPAPTGGRLGRKVKP